MADFERLTQAWMEEAERRSREGLEALVAPAPRLTIGPWTHFEGFESWFRDCVELLDERSDALAGRAEAGAPEAPTVSVFFLGLGPEVAEACSRQRPREERRCCRCWGRGETVDVVKGTGLTDPKMPLTKNDGQHCGWRSFSSWPPAAAADCDLHLAIGRKELLPPGSPTDNGAAEFVFNPAEPTPSFGGALFDRVAAGRRDVALDCHRHDVVFLDSPTLSKALEIAGHPRVSVWVELAECNSSDIFCRLLDVAPDGRVLPVCDGVLRLRTGAAQLAVVDLACTAAHFAPGHRLRLLFSGGAFPRFDANTGYAEDGFRGVRRQPQRIRLSDVLAVSIERSAVTLPVLGGVAAANAAWDT